MGRYVCLFIQIHIYIYICRESYIHLPEDAAATCADSELREGDEMEGDADEDHNQYHRFTPEPERSRQVLPAGPPG